LSKLLNGDSYPLEDELMAKVVLRIIVFALTPLIVWSEEMVDGLPEKVPVFLKFHKVASQSAKRFFELSLRDRVMPHWLGNGTGFCPQDPWSHLTLPVYRSDGISGLRRCFSTDQSLNFVGVTLMRDPLERLLSSIYFFRPKLSEIVSRSENDAARRSGMAALAKIKQNRSRDISPDEMNSLFCIMNETGRKDLLVSEYEITFAKHVPVRSFNPTESTLRKAIENMNKDIEVIGITEELPTFFTLASRVFGIPLRYSCSLHLQHMADKKYLEIFQQTKRPPPELLFTPPVLKFLDEQLKGEKALWQHARLQHEFRLSTFGLSVESAKREWAAACPLKDPAKKSE
jgi:hypothetical protein